MGYGFESHILYKKKYIRVYSRGEKPALEAGSGEFDPLHPNNPVRNSVVEAHSDEMVVDGSSPSVPTNVAHKV